MLAPGEAWRDAKNAMTPSMSARLAATLRATAPDDAQLGYILAPFAALNDGDKWWLAAITDPCPVNAPECLTWEPDGEVILIDGATGAMQTFDRDEGVLIEPIDALVHDGSVKLYANGITFARDWAANRAQWIEGIARNVVPGCRAEPAGQPGIALCGSLARVADFAPVKAASSVVVDDPRIMRELTKLLLQSARLPTVEAMPPRLRVAA